MTQVREEPIDALVRHGEVSIAFEVRSVLDVDALDDDVPRFVEQPVAPPWRKDYDAADGGPGRWADRFDVARWGLLGAYLDDRGGQRVGGAVVAFDTPGVHLLRGRRDLAVLWDLRVADGARRSGVGTALFRAAEDWARARGCTELEVETQQINVGACRFYARMGCELATVQRGAYAGAPDEVQLIWRRGLG